MEETVHVITDAPVRSIPRKVVQVPVIVVYAVVFVLMYLVVRAMQARHVYSEELAQQWSTEQNWRYQQAYAEAQAKFQ